MAEKLYFKVTSEYENVKAICFLKGVCNLSSRMITRLKREKDGILMDGKILRTIDNVKCGSTVEINLPQEASLITPVKGRLDIVYEDKYLLIVNKPYNMPVHPVKQHQTDTLANIVSDYMPSKNENYVFRAINRLDKDTSGIVIIAKDRYTANAIKNKTSKTYYALCHGRLEGEGTVNAPIGMLEGSKMVRTVVADGMPSVTHYKSIFCCDEFSFISLVLETGRTHQIRCHMSSIGHPLLGDDLYGGSLDKTTRQMLHCGKIELIHPVTSENLLLKAELPDDMKTILYEKKED